MKKILKVLGIIILLVAVIIGAAATFISVRGIPKYEPGKIVLKVEATPQRLERGKKLVNLLCKGCHYNPQTEALTGRLMAEAPPEFGKIHSQNITQSEKYGIAGWSDGEIAYLLRTGVKKDGQYAPPYMAKLPLMSDEDIASIIAFLHSDDPLVKAKDVEDFPCEPTFLVKFLSTVAFKPLPYPTQEIMAPDTADHVKYGRYLALGVIDCYTCHSADFKTNDAMVPEHSAGFLGGGNQLTDPDGHPLFSANLTPDEKTGIGSWSKDQFISAVMYGKRPDGRMLRNPMVPFVDLDSAEVGYIYEYLRTVPALAHEVNRNFK